jgi:hypothetical protein
MVNLQKKRKEKKSFHVILYHNDNQIHLETKKKLEHKLIIQLSLEKKELRFW